MADKNDDIKHLFEHLGLDPTDYQEIKGPTKVVESARRWSLLGEVSEHPPRAAEIPEERRQVVAQLSAANRAQRIATIRNDELAQPPNTDRTPKPAEDRGEVDALRRPPSSGRLPPTVTWATDDADIDDTNLEAESRVEPEFDAGPSADENKDNSATLAAEFDVTEDSELTESESADGDASGSASSSGESTHSAADDDERESDEAEAEANAEAARRADEDAEEAAAARAVREAVEARNARERAAKAARSADDEPAADINLLGDFADSIGAPPEPVGIPSARDAEPRRKPQPKAAPSRAASRPADAEQREAPAGERGAGAAAAESKSKTGAAIQGLLAATQRVKPTPTVSRSRARAVDEAPASSRSAEPGYGHRQKTGGAGPSPESAAPTPAASRKAPEADAPSQERRQHAREDFESAIEAVAQAAKAEVRRRVEDERKQSVAPEVPPEDSEFDEPIAAVAEPQGEPLVAEERPSAEFQGQPSPERIAASAAGAGRKEPAPKPELPVTRDLSEPEPEPTPKPDLGIRQPERARPESLASVAQASKSDHPAAATSREAEPHQAATAPQRERALPASGRVGPSPLRKLREAQPAEVSMSEEAAVDEHAARKGRLSDTFRRLQTPEKPAISASGKLRLNYGIRGGAQGVRTAQPETINEVFDRLRRNRRPGEPRK